MRIYDCAADCLVDYVTLHYYVKARNEKQAWLKGYIYFNNLSVADGGTVDCKRLKDFTRIRGLKSYDSSRYK